MYTVLANFGIMDTHVARPVARDLAMRALRFDPSNGGAYRSSVPRHSSMNTTFPLARRHFERGIELSPQTLGPVAPPPFLRRNRRLRNGEGPDTPQRCRRPDDPFAHLIDAWPYYLLRVERSHHALRTRG